MILMLHIHPSVACRSFYAHAKVYHKAIALHKNGIEYSLGVEPSAPPTTFSKISTELVRAAVERMTVSNSEYLGQACVKSISR
jgi:hypothetical protein